MFHLSRLLRGCNLPGPRNRLRLLLSPAPSSIWDASCWNGTGKATLCGCLTDCIFSPRPSQPMMGQALKLQHAALAHCPAAMSGWPEAFRREHVEALRFGLISNPLPALGFRRGAQGFRDRALGDHLMATSCGHLRPDGDAPVEIGIPPAGHFVLRVNC